MLTQFVSYLSVAALLCFVFVFFCLLFVFVCLFCCFLLLLFWFFGFGFWWGLFCFFCFFLRSLCFFFLFHSVSIIINNLSDLLRDTSARGKLLIIEDHEKFLPLEWLILGMMTQANRHFVKSTLTVAGRLHRITCCKTVFAVWLCLFGFGWTRKKG